MRASIVLAALAVSLALTGPAPAQVPAAFGFSQSQPTTRLSPPQSRGYISPSNFLGSRFKLGNLFGDWGNITNRHHLGSSTIPRPDSPAYLQAFGYQRIR